MKISIITPSLNQGKFIDDTIKSVIYQEGDFELEYIIMDGGSTDNTLKTIKKYDKLVHSKEFKPRCKKLIFKWFSEKDNGQSHAINKGFRIAKGDIINWLCSDDTLLPGSLAEISHIFKDANINVIFGNSILVKNNKIRKLKGKVFKRKELINVWSNYNHKFYIPQPTTFFRRNILKQTGLLDESNNLCMDYEFYLRVSRDYQFHYIDKNISVIRLHNNAKSVKYKYRQYSEIIRISRKYWNNFGTLMHMYFILSYYLHRPLDKIKQLAVELYDNIISS